MKRFLCICSQCLSVLFFIFWILIFFAVPQMAEFNLFNVLMISNAVLVAASLIIGCTYFEMSIDKFFSWYPDDVLPLKEKLIIGIEILINGVCFITFACMILQHNLQNVNLSDWEDIRLKCIGLIMANSWLWYAAYQTHHCLKKATRKVN